MSINVRELSLLLKEYNELTNKLRMSKADEQRCGYLQTAIAAVKAGASLEDVDREFHNERSRAAGMPIIAPEAKSFSREQEKEARVWQGFVNGEYRALAEGNLADQIGTYSGLSYFVPTGWFPELFRALRQHDALFDEDLVTLIKTTNGAPLPIPIADDTGHTASVVTEAGEQTSVDFDSTSHAVLGAFTYASDRYVASIESFQDLSGAITMTGLAKEFFQDKIARGIGRDLVLGEGTTKPLGLIPSLEALGVPPVIAKGSAINTGGTETASNSLGSQDFADALANLDEAYIGPKTAWLMNKKTLAGLLATVTKMGQPLDLVKFINGVPTIYSIPVRIAPSMPSVGASRVPVILGDFRYWATRLITADEGVGLKVYSEAPGLAEKGNVGIRCFTRADGALLWNAIDSPGPSSCPFVLIRCFS